MRKNNSSFGPKIRYACKRARQQSNGEKVLIWSSFVENVELIADELSDWEQFTRGDVPTIDNENSEDSYNQRISSLPVMMRRKQERLEFTDLKMITVVW